MKKATWFYVVLGMVGLVALLAYVFDVDPLLREEQDRVAETQIQPSEEQIQPKEEQHDSRVETVAKHEWVNPVEGARDTCSIDLGNKLEEVSRSGGQVLVRVVSANGYQVSCSVGDEILLPESHFSSMTERYEALIDELEERNSIVKELTSNPVENPRRYTITSHVWVNPVKVNNSLDELISNYKDNCYIDQYSDLKEVGSHEGQVLVQLTSGVPTSGTSCNPDSYMFVPEDSLTEM